MALTRLSAGKVIEMSFDDRRVETIPEAKMVRMRDGKDLETELKARQKYPEDHTFELSRTPFGDLEVTAIYVRKR